MKINLTEIRQRVVVPAEPDEVYESFMDAESTRNSLVARQHVIQRLVENSRLGMDTFLGRILS